jgi:hypothetical protein
MKSIPAERRVFEFCFLELDYTLVRVEESAGEVTIRATADTFSRKRKSSFIRELAAEGFIPDEYQWGSLSETGADFRGLRWVVDNSWLKIDEALNARNHRVVRRLIVPVTLLWLLMLYLVFPTQNKPGSVRVKDQPSAALRFSRSQARPGPFAVT